MSQRIAHRPRYHAMRQPPQSPRHFLKKYYRDHWTYRRLTIPYQKQPLSQRLRFVPFGYHLAYGIRIG